MPSVGRVRGVRIDLHPSLLVFLPLFLWLAAGGPFGGSRLAWLEGALLAAGLLASLLLHALAHAEAARREGAPARRASLLPVGERLVLARPLPDARSEMRVALAGPLANLGLGTLAYAFASLGPPGAALLSALGALNLALALANLAVPAWPLDSGPLLRALLSPRLGRAAAARFASALGQGCAAVFALWGVLAADAWLLAVAALVLMGALREGTPDRPPVALRVADLLPRPMPGVPATATVEAARERMLAARLPYLPVVADRRPVGVVRQEDVEAVGDSERWWVPVGALARAGYHAFSPSDDGEEALEALDRGTPVLVVDGEGRLLGFVTRAVPPRLRAAWR